MKKKLCKIFKDNGLNITVVANVQNVNFLDMNLDLSTGIFKPYMKENDKPIYVHCESNHTPGIIRNVPKSVNKRLNTISANQEVFLAAIPPFKEALPKSGYDYKLTFSPAEMKKKQKQTQKHHIFQPTLL